MKDPTSEYMTALATAIDGNVTYGSTAFNTVEDIPRNGKYNYIHLVDMNMTDESVQDENIANYTLEIEVVCEGAKHKTYSTKLNNVTNSVMQIVEGSFLSMTNFTVTIAPKITSKNKLTEETEKGMILRNNLSFDLQIEEN